MNLSFKLRMNFSFKLYTFFSITEMSIIKTKYLHALDFVMDNNVNLYCMDAMVVKVFMILNKIERANVATILSVTFC